MRSGFSFYWFPGCSFWRAEALLEFYSDVPILNQHILARETYRLGNQAMTSFNEVLRVLDTFLQKAIQEALTAHASAQKAIEAAPR